MAFPLRELVHEACQVAIDAADPAACVRRALASQDNVLSSARRVHLIAAGKAAIEMIAAARDIVAADKQGAMIAVTNYENMRLIDGVDVHAARHPLPDEAGAAAARAVERVAQDAKEGELVICLISGGASALLPAPVEPLTLNDKTAVTDLLLKSGADIVEINTVRKALSRLKGGGLARAIYPADFLSLILSDVPGDNLSAIASGPTVAEPEPGNPMAVIRRYGLESDIPPVALDILAKHGSQQMDTPPASGHNVLVGSNALSVAAVRAFLEQSGFAVTVLSDWLEGDAGDAARRFLSVARTLGTGPQALIAGGETSVVVRGTGQGGRNQHMALTFALAEGGHLERPFVFASCGTDGRDGPTDAAGGIVDNATTALALRRGVNLTDRLANDDSYNGLKAVDGLIVTGGTGTNVADIQILLLG